MNAQLPVDSRALDASQDAQVGGEPRRICQREGVLMSWLPDKQETEVSPCQAAEPGALNSWECYP